MRTPRDGTLALSRATSHDGIPEVIRIEYLSMALTLVSLVLRYSVMGTSIAMLAALMEDVTELIAPISILLTLYLEGLPHTPRHPFGFQRIGSLSFLAAAGALMALGLLVLFQAANRLLEGGAPAFGEVDVFGWQVWWGWVMAAVLMVTNVIMLPVIRAKRGLSERVRLAALATDTHANISHVAVGLGATLGVILTRLGWWWTDPLMALVIGAAIFADGVQHLAVAARELIDVAPPPETMVTLSAVVAAQPYVRQHYWLARKVGRFIDADLLIACDDATLAETDRWRAELDRELRATNWQLHDLVIAFGHELPLGKQEDLATLIMAADRKSEATAPAGDQGDLPIAGARE